MEYHRYCRTVVPIGGIFEKVDEALSFVNDFEGEIITEQIKNLRFFVDDEGYLVTEINNRFNYISHSALKDLCRLLKLPASFINKFPISRLILDTLNQNPYLIDDGHMINLILWKWDDREVIAGILPIDTSSISLIDYLNILKEEGVFNREEALIDAIVITGEEIVLYFLLNKEVQRERFGFTGGFSIHYSPTRAVDTIIYPFYRMLVTTSTGEYFDFDFESNKKLHVARRRKRDFEEATLNLSINYLGEDLGIDFETTLKRGIAAREISSLKFSVVKYLKSRASSVYNFAGMKIKSGVIVEEIIPEYKHFVEAHREQLQNREKYEINTMMVDFFLPAYYNRLFTFRSSSENPYYFIRYRQAIGKIFDKILEEIGDIVIAEQTDQSMNIR